MRRRFTFASLVMLALLIASCSSKPTLVFDAGSSELDVGVRVKSLDESTRRYDLKIAEAVAPTLSEPALRIDVAGSFESVSVEVPRGDGDADRTILYPLTAPAPHRFFVPLRRDTRFDSVSLEVTRPGADFELDGIGIAAETREVSLGARVEIDTRIEASVSRGNPRSVYRFDLSALEPDFTDGGRIAGIEITYYLPADVDVEGERSHEVVLEVTRPTARATYRFAARPGGGSVYLYPASIGFVPQSVELVSHDTVFVLSTLRVFRLATDGLAPIPADLATILDYDSSDWRRGEYELFRWSRYPSILVLDTRDYAVQAAFFKRLSFYVEKRGYAGRVLGNEELSRRHGWNAHDYRSTDLAAFFTVVDEAELFPEEVLLREVLLAEGVITENGAGYRSGSGGILSLSRETTPRLRRLFMVHEGFHGVFFADDAFRDAVFDVWRGLDDRERALWRLFLARRFYNTDDEYLMVNEFQAYLMQQPLDQVDDYFIAHAMPLLKAGSPADSDFVDDVLADFPDTFAASALAVARAAQSAGGMSAGSLFTLVREVR